MGHWVRTSRVRASQPQGVVGIDFSNDLGSGVRHYQTGTDTGLWTAPNGIARTAGTLGLNTSFAAASSHYLKAPAKVTGYPFTMAAVVRRKSTGTNQAILSIGAATNDRHLLYFASDDQAYAFSGAGATVGQANSITTCTSLTQYYVVVGVFFSATARSIYVDGVLKSTNTTNVIPAAADTACVGAYWTSGAPTAAFYQNGDIPVSLISNKAWTAEQVARWSKNQASYWQIFQPEVISVYYPSAGGGGTTYNDSFTESLTAADSYTSALTAVASITESTTVSDSYATALTALASVVESTTLADAYATALTALVTLGESITLADSYADALNGGGTTYNESFTEALTVGDTYGATLIALASIVEAATLGDSLANISTMAASYTQAIALADSYADSGGLYVADAARTIMVGAEYRTLSVPLESRVWTVN